MLGPSARLFLCVYCRRQVLLCRLQFSWRPWASLYRAKVFQCLSEPSALQCCLGLLEARNEAPQLGQGVAQPLRSLNGVLAHRVYGICPPSDFKPGPILPAARPCQAVLAAFVDFPEGEHQKLIDSVLAAAVERRQSLGVG